MVDLVDDPQAEAAGLFPEIEVARGAHPDRGGARSRSPVPTSHRADRRPGWRSTPRRCWSDLGLSPAEIEALAADGVVGVADANAGG